MAKNKEPGYFSSVAKAAPAFGLKAVLGDLPKGIIEHTTEAKLRGSKDSFKNLLRQGAVGRGGGRAIGAGIGIATAPIFLKGLKNVGSDDPKKQRTGLALLGSTAAAYQGQKGFIEGYRSSMAAKSGRSTAIKRGLALGGTRIGYKTPAAIALGLSIASGRKKSKQPGGSKYTKFLMPALSGAALGALSRGTESITMGGLGGGRKGLLRAFKKAVPAAGGGAAGGLLGGLVLSAAVDGAMKAMKKKGSVDIEKTAIPIAAEALGSLLAIHAGTKGAMGYGRIGRGLSKVPGLRRLQPGMQKLKTRHLAIGIREGLSGRKIPGYRATVVGGFTVPELGYNRAMGLGIGKLLRGVPPEHRETALRTVQKYITPAMKQSKGGDPTPLWSQLPKAIDMAVGKEPLFKRTGMAGAWNALMHGGRGAYSKGGRRVTGLPQAGIADPNKSGVAGDLTLLGLGGAGLAATGGLAGIPALAGTMLASHAGMSGIKGLGVRSKFVKDRALKSGAEGIRAAFLPGMRRPFGTKAGEKFMDYGISPASRDLGRTVGGMARGVAEFGRRGAAGGLQKRLHKMVSPASLAFSDKITKPIIGGAALAGAHKLGQN